MTAKELKFKYGVTQQALPATRLLFRKMDHDFGCRAETVLVINETDGNVISVNAYGEDANCHTGKGYDPSRMTQDLPGPESDKWKKWTKEGYKPCPISRFPIFTPIDAEIEAQAQADWDAKLAGVKVEAPEVEDVCDDSPFNPEVSEDVDETSEDDEIDDDEIDEEALEAEELAALDR